MRVHCLGGSKPFDPSLQPEQIRCNQLTIPSLLVVGSIGSLLATQLAQLPSTKVRLILRRKDIASALFSSKESNPSLSSFSPEKGALVSLQMERNGLVKRTDGLEVELTPSPEDRALIGRTDFAATFFASKKFPDLVRNDPIDTLIITTKAPSTLKALKGLLPRLSSQSTIVILQNGMGVLEGMLDTYWPDEVPSSNDFGASGLSGRPQGRPNFVCATTTHGVWRKNSSHFVHAGLGDIKFGVVPNRAAQASLVSTDPSPWGEHYHNPLLNPRSLTSPTLEHLPLTPDTVSLHRTVSALLQLKELNTAWLPLPTFQIAQLQKLAVNTAVNGLTAIMGVPNGALVGSPNSKRIISTICKECSSVFAAHVGREEGSWTPPPVSYSSPLSPSPAPSLSTPHPPPPPLPSSHPLSTESLTDYTLQVLFKTSTNFSSTLLDILNISPKISNANPLSSSSFSYSATEIEYLNGYVVALGERYGIPTPFVECVRSMVLLKEETLKAGSVDLVLEKRSEKLAAAATPRKSGSVFSRSTSTEGSRVGGVLKSAYQRAQDVKNGKLIKSRGEGG